MLNCLKSVLFHFLLCGGFFCRCSNSVTEEVDGVFGGWKGHGRVHLLAPCLGHTVPGWPVWPAWPARFCRAGPAFRGLLRFDLCKLVSMPLLCSLFNSKVKYSGSTSSLLVFSSFNVKLGNIFFPSKNSTVYLCRIFIVLTAFS